MPRTMRETPASRALRAAVAEELDAMRARIPKGTKGSAKKAARDVARALAKGRAKWDRETPAWRKMRAAKILAELRRYDKGATLPDDGGRDLYATRKLLLAPAAPAPDLYAAHRNPVASPAPAKGTTTDTAAPTDELAERRKKRRGPRAGHAGYIDPRLFDTDDWD